MQYFIYCTSKIIYILPVCNYFPFKTTMYKLGPTLRTYDWRICRIHLMRNIILTISLICPSCTVHACTVHYSKNALCS